MILDRFGMTDKVAIVTGAGRGIGAASAVSLAEAGADVVISARTADQLGEVAKRIEAVGRKAVAVPADLNDLEAVAALVEHAREAFGRLDLVVNNVGGTMPQAFMDTSADVMEQAFHFNVATAHALLRPAVPLMLEGGGGSAVNISSAMGRLTGRGFWPTALPKGRWPTTPGWPRPTSPHTSGSMPSRWDRWPPRRSTSSCSPTNCGRPWRPARRSAVSATPRTLPPR